MKVGGRGEGGGGRGREGNRDCYMYIHVRIYKPSGAQEREAMGESCRNEEYRPRP